MSHEGGSTSPFHSFKDCTNKENRARVLFEICIWLSEVISRRKVSRELEENGYCTSVRRDGGYTRLGVSKTNVILAPITQSGIGVTPIRPSQTYSPNFYPLRDTAGLWHSKWGRDGNAVSPFLMEPGEAMVAFRGPSCKLSTVWFTVIYQEPYAYFINEETKAEGCEAKQHSWAENKQTNQRSYLDLEWRYLISCYQIIWKGSHGASTGRVTTRWPRTHHLNIWWVEIISKLKQLLAITDLMTLMLGQETETHNVTCSGATARFWQAGAKVFSIP